MEPSELPTVSIITPGPYVIRNRCNRKVLHIHNSNLAAIPKGRVYMQNQLEEWYHCQQVWWIEPVPGSETGEHLVTHLPSGKVLSLASSAGNKSVDGGDGDDDSDFLVNSLYAADLSGGPWQRWLFKLHEDEEGIFYRIQYIDTYGNFHWASGDAGDSSRQQWELVVPLTAVPAGWVHIKNSASNYLLDHSHIACPPTLFPAPSLSSAEKMSVPSKAYASWGTQWCFARPKTYDPENKNNAATWVIKNRLTGGVLAKAIKQSRHGDSWLDVAAWTMQAYREELAIANKENQKFSYEWILDKTVFGDWKLSDSLTRCVLTQPDADSHTLACKDTAYKASFARKRWIIEPVKSEEPPAYERM